MYRGCMIEPPGRDVGNHDSVADTKVIPNRLRPLPRF